MSSHPTTDPAPSLGKSLASAAAILSVGYALGKSDILGKILTHVQNRKSGRFSPSKHEPSAVAHHNTHPVYDSNTPYQVKFVCKPRSVAKREAREAALNGGRNQPIDNNDDAHCGEKLATPEDGNGGGDMDSRVSVCQKQYLKSKDARSNAVAQSEASFSYAIEYDAEASRNKSFEVIHADAIEWLLKQETLNGSVFTSMPDFTEMQWGVDKWRPWFTNAAKVILEKIPDGHYAVFYQTDVKRIGQKISPTSGEKVAEMNEWIDKAHMIQSAADRVDGVKLLWHRIFLIADVGARKVGRPTYSHMLCFGKGGAVVPDASRPGLPDVLSRGEMLSAKATGLNACVFGALCLRLYGQTKIIDPFCGRASTLLAAKLMGMETVGVDISRTVCGTARTLGSQGFDAYVDVVFKSTFLKHASDDKKYKARRREWISSQKKNTMTVPEEQNLALGE